jgi:hypothetical protein
MTDQAILPAAAAAAILAACATAPTDVVKLGAGSYSAVGTPATVLFSGSIEKFRLIKTANTYCKNQGKQSVLLGIKNLSGQPPVAEVVFRCQYERLTSYFFR